MIRSGAEAARTTVPQRPRRTPTAPGWPATGAESLLRGSPAAGPASRCGDARLRLTARTQLHGACPDRRPGPTLSRNRRVGSCRRSKILSSKTEGSWQTARGRSPAATLDPARPLCLLLARSGGIATAMTEPPSGTAARSRCHQRARPREQPSPAVRALTANAGDCIAPSKHSRLAPVAEQPSGDPRTFNSRS